MSKDRKTTITCGKCGGSGQVQNRDGKPPVTCSNCGGSGQVRL